MLTSEFTPKQRRFLINHLSNCLTDRRLETLKQAIDQRTNYFTIALENIFQSQNASATLRTCECFGLQDVHIIENDNRFGVNPKVVMGATKWLSLYHYNTNEHNSQMAIDNLKQKGYRIIATSPHVNGVTLNDFDVTNGKFALFFGTELTGLSKTVLNNADEYMRVPTVGLTESLNLSVTVGICVNLLSNKLRNCNVNYSLSDQEKELLLHHWLRKTVKSWKSIESRYLKQIEK